jgi:hypothetical protein
MMLRDALNTEAHRQIVIPKTVLSDSDMSAVLGLTIANATTKPKHTNIAMYSNLVMFSPLMNYASSEVQNGVRLYRMVASASGSIVNDHIYSRKLQTLKKERRVMVRSLAFFVGGSASIDFTLRSVHGLWFVRSITGVIRVSIQADLNIW